MKKFIYLFLVFALSGCATLGGKTSLEYQAMGEMYYKTGNLKKSLTNFNKAIKKDKYNIEAYEGRGALLFELKEYESALGDFTILKTAQPQRSEAYSASGACLAAMGDNLAAREDLLKALELNEENVEARCTLAGVYFSTQNYKASIEEYTKALEINPAPMIYAARGIVYLHYGKVAEANADFKESGIPEDKYPQLADFTN